MIPALGHIHMRSIELFRARFGRSPGRSFSHTTAYSRLNQREPSSSSSSPRSRSGRWHVNGTPIKAELVPDEWITLRRSQRLAMAARGQSLTVSDLRGCPEPAISKLAMRVRSRHPLHTPDGPQQKGTSSTVGLCRSGLLAGRPVVAQFPSRTR